GRKLRLRVGGRLAERGIRAHLFVQSDLVHHLGVSLLAKRPEQSGTSLLRLSVVGIRARFSDDGIAASGGSAFQQIYARGLRCFAGVLAGGSPGRADLSGVAPQFPANRAAEEPRVRGFGDLSGAVVPEPGAAGKRLAGAGAASGSFRVDIAVCPGDFYRAAAARAGTNVTRDRASRNGTRAAADGGDPAGSEAGRDGRAG